jgi:hypothetical protein
VAFAVDVQRAVSTVGGTGEDGARPDQRRRPRVIVQLRNAENAPLVVLGGPDDFVISDALGSQIISQFAEAPVRRSVLLQLYSPEGASVHMEEPATSGLAGVTVFADVVSAVASAGLVAVGWRTSRERGGELFLAPPMATTLDLQPSDGIVVIG